MEKTSLRQLGCAFASRTAAGTRISTCQSAASTREPSRSHYIDVADWKAHTEYAGGLSATSGVGSYFWRVIDNDFDDEQRTRMLQFVTGTSRLPAGGFKNLQGVDGKNKMFKLQGIGGGDHAVPQSHTCFNRLDLPKYSSYEHTRLVLINLVACDVEGFSID